LRRHGDGRDVARRIARRRACEAARGPGSRGRAPAMTSLTGCRPLTVPASWPALGPILHLERLLADTDAAAARPRAASALPHEWCHVARRPACRQFRPRTKGGSPFCITAAVSWHLPGGACRGPASCLTSRDHVNAPDGRASAICPMATATRTPARRGARVASSCSPAVGRRSLTEQQPAPWCAARSRPRCGAPGGPPGDLRQTRHGRQDRA
jgi:hypothetical protein